MKMNTYLKIELYNDPNGLTLYAVDFTSELIDSVVVFLSEIEADAWVAMQMCQLKAYGIEMTYDPDKHVREKILDMYENARELKIARGKVWIA